MRIRFSNTYLLAIIACILWSTAFVGIKIGLKYSSPLNFAGFRFLLAGVLVIPFTGGFKQYKSEVLKNHRFLFKISLFQTVLLYSLLYFGLSFTSASVTAIIVGTGPLFVAILAHFLVENERLTFKRILSILIGFSGIVLIASDNFNQETNGITGFLGVLILLCSNIAGSFGNILVHKDKTGMSPLIMNSFQQIAGGIFLILLSIFTEDLNFTLIKPPKFYISLIYLSILSAIAFSIWFILLKRPKVRVSEINIWKFLVPVFGALLSWVILSDDYPEVTSVIGMITIAFSLIILNYEKIDIRIKNHRNKQKNKL